MYCLTPWKPLIWGEVGYFIYDDGHIPKNDVLIVSSFNMVLIIFCSVTLFKKMINYREIFKQISEFGDLYILLFIPMVVI